MKIFIFVALFSFSAFSTDKKDVIYGEDNRLDVFESKNSAFVEYSRATAAMVPNILLHAMGEETLLRSTTLEQRGICPSERFAQQPTTAKCSGFLVADNILVTAGHCIRNDADCKINRWVFDAKLDSREQSQITVPTKNVYWCKKILARAFEEGNGADYAVIELAKKVSDRRPLQIRKSGTVEVGAPLVVIGHPSGLPTKISDGANVRSVENKYLVANLDTFGGNSGSAVLNVITGEVEGILVRGENDYIDDSTLGCQVANHCQNAGCRGEDVNLIGIIDVLK